MPILPTVNRIWHCCHRFAVVSPVPSFLKVCWVRKTCQVPVANEAHLSSAKMVWTSWWLKNPTHQPTKGWKPPLSLGTSAHQSHDFEPCHNQVGLKLGHDSIHPELGASIAWISDLFVLVGKDQFIDIYRVPLDPLKMNPRSMSRRILGCNTWIYRSNPASPPRQVVLDTRVHGIWSCIRAYNIYMSNLYNRNQSNDKSLTNIKITQNRIRFTANITVICERVWIKII